MVDSRIAQMKPSQYETPRILRQLLLESLDQDTFTVLESMSRELESAERCLVVDQLGQSSDDSQHILCAPPENSRVVAVVDRSADIAAAAAFIANARLAFNGRSPYAPDVVLVNEFVLGTFLKAVVEAFTQKIVNSRPGSTEESGADRQKREDRDHVLSKEDREDPDTTVVLGGEKCSLISVGNR